MNDDDPVGTKCLENAMAPPVHRGPLLDHCQPGRYANSVSRATMNRAIDVPATDVRTQPR